MVFSIKKMTGKSNVIGVMLPRKERFKFYFSQVKQDVY